MRRAAACWRLVPLAAALAACGGDSGDAAQPVAGPLVSLSVPGHPHAVDAYESEGATRAIVVLHGGGGYPAPTRRKVSMWPRRPRADAWSNHAMSSGQDDKAFLQSLAAQIRARYGTVRQHWCCSGWAVRRTGWPRWTR